jgi:D-glycero-beta-D-manno-heptose 1-phosphate adenylyltransferase
VNGAEYGEHCVERDVVIGNGGRLHLVDRIPNLSTSGLASRLATAAIGRQQQAENG